MSFSPCFDPFAIMCFRLRHSHYYLLLGGFYIWRPHGGGGKKIPQICGQTVHKIWTKGGEGGVKIGESKNPKNLRTSCIEAPFAPGKLLRSGNSKLPWEQRYSAKNMHATNSVFGSTITNQPRRGKKVIAWLQPVLASTVSVLQCWRWQTDIDVHILTFPNFATAPPHPAYSDTS